MNFNPDTPLLIANAFKHDDDNNGDFIVAQMTPEFIVEAAGKVPGAAYVAFREDESFVLLDHPITCGEDEDLQESIRPGRAQLLLGLAHPQPGPVV